MPKIFLASSTESKDLAETIAQALAQAGYTPLRWWVEFPGGEYPPETLARKANESDGAVFLCRADDQITSRGLSGAIPRDNVIFELGFFMRNYVRELCLILKDEHAKLPTDLAGLSHHDIIDDHQTVANRVVDHFKDALPKYTDNERFRQIDRSKRYISIRIDPKVAADLNRPRLPPKWHQRALYCGTEGARAWLDFARDIDDLFSDKDSRADRRILLGSVRKLPVDVFVSLGPGAADKDKELVVELAKFNRDITYIPVDISEGLINHAWRVIAGRTPIPFGVLSDFEERLEFIGDLIRKRTTGTRLYSLLGNTFGNLDLFEQTFLNDISSQMENGDLLLIDVGIRKGDWNFSDDSVSGKLFASDVRRRFIVNGIARQAGKSRERLLKEFDQRVRVRPGYSDIGGTEAYEIYDTDTGLVAFCVRRYDWDQLRDWIGNHYDGQFREKYAKNIYYDEANLGTGILLLERVTHG